MRARIEANWVYGGLLAAIILLLLVPSLEWQLPALLTFLALPAYMFHQFEEHDNGRFKAYINEMIGSDHRGLDDTAIFVINFFGVWVILTLVIVLARLVDPGWSTIAAYLMLINAVVHILPALAFKKYNPGLATAIVVFLPLGTLILMNGEPDLSQHLTGIVAIVSLHVLIVFYARSPVSKVKS